MLKNLAIRIGILALVVMVMGACQSKLDVSPTPVPQTEIPPTPKPSQPLAFINARVDLGKGAGNCVVTGDVNGDSYIDALISTDGPGSTLWLNDGKGKLSLSDQGFKASTCAAFGDLNGDTSIDIFFTEGRSNQVWLNDGKGEFTTTGQKLASFDSSSVALGDLDSDGDLDAYVTVWSGQPDLVFLNDGKGNFTDSGQKLGKRYGSDVALGDVDADGDLDALVSNNGEEKDNASALWLNDGQARFTESPQKLGPTNASAVALGDLDGDGDLDAFIANSSHRGANPADKVWFNDGQGTFTDSGQSLGKSYSLSVELGDLDGDDDLDAFAGSWKETPHIWLNDGTGKFADSPLKLYSPNSDGIAIADVDGDEDLDVLASINTWDGGDGQHKLWLNQIYP